MPNKPKRPCNKIGCHNLTTERYCDQHKQQEQYSYDKQRGNSAQRGYNSRWRKYRQAFLKAHPLCECDDCKQRVVPLPADVVDHIKPHKGDSMLFWDASNHQAMNHVCHNRKTAREDMGAW